MDYKTPIFPSAIIDIALVFWKQYFIPHSTTFPKFSMAIHCSDFKSLKYSVGNLQFF